MAKVYKVGTRISPLALKQVEEIEIQLKRVYSDIKLEIVGIDTIGDKNKAIPISGIEGTDFFTKEIDDALLNGEVDFSVNSAKDLPDKLKKGLTVAAITESIDPYDVLVSKNNLTLDSLPIDAKIGTSSMRRKKQLKKYRKDFHILDIRGNIEERLEILNKTGLDAIVIAAAGLIRLGLEGRISQRIPLNILGPHPLQGKLALVVKDNNIELINKLSILDRDKVQ